MRLTVNLELQNRIDELAQSNDDMKNLLDSTNIAMIFLDVTMNIRRFTPRAVDIFPLTNSDIGRPISHLKINLEEQDIVAEAKRVIGNLDKIEKKVKNLNNSIFLMRIFPYRTASNIIDGVVITCVEITELERLNETLPVPD